jgi:RNase P subunit RPR2
MSEQRAKMEWRCRKCQTLLGTARLNKLHLRNHEADFLVYGGILAVCVRCREIHEFVTQAADSQPVADVQEVAR